MLDDLSDYKIPEGLDERKALARELATDVWGMDAIVHLLSLISQDRDPDVRRLVVGTLESRCHYGDLIGPEIEAIVYPMVRMGLEGESSEFQLACLSLLKAAESGRGSGRNGRDPNLRADGKWAIPYVIEVIVDDVDRVRSLAVDVLWLFDREELEIGATVPGSIDTRRSLSVKIRRLLSDLSPNPSDTGTIRFFLKHRDPELRKLGLLATGWMGPSLIPRVTEFLEDRETVVRLGAVGALERIGPHALPVLVRFSESLGCTCEAERDVAISTERDSAFGLDGSETRAPAVDASVGKTAGTVADLDRQSLISDDIARVHVRTIRAIGHLESQARIALPAIKNALGLRHTGIRVAAIDAWSRIADSAADILPDIVRLVDDSDQPVADAAGSVVRWLLHWEGDCPHDLREAILLLDGAIKTTSTCSPVYNCIPIYTCQIIQREDLASLLPGVLDTISLALSSKESNALIAGLFAVNELGARGSKFAPEIGAMIERYARDEIPADETDGGRVAGCGFMALRAIGAGAATVVPQLRGMLNSSNEDVRWNAARTLAAIDPQQENALAFLYGMRDSTIKEDRDRAKHWLDRLAKGQHP